MNLLALHVKSEARISQEFVCDEICLANLDVIIAADGGICHSWPRHREEIRTGNAGGVIEFGSGIIVNS